MLFNDLLDEILPFTLNEKYYKYSIPTTSKTGSALIPADTNKYLMYDFYVLDYLKFLVDEMPSKQFRDLSPEIEASVNDAVNTLFPYLREELLNAVFYAICAEMRHSDVYRERNRNLVKDDGRYIELYKYYLKYNKFHNSSTKEQEDALTLYDVRKPSSKVRPPELELQNDKSRNISFKAANYAIKKTGMSRRDFVNLSNLLYKSGGWNSSYGGPAWGRICDGWLTLESSEKLTPQTKQSIDSHVKPMGVAIDHVYDLQHNTDTVFNKLKSYYSDSKGHSWIKTALDHKANVKSFYELLKHTSGTVRSMAMPVFYNKLGTTWESDIRKNNPDKLFNRETDGEILKDGDYVIYKGDGSSNDMSFSLTPGKVYKLLRVINSTTFKLVNDDGNTIKVDFNKSNVFTKTDEPPKKQRTPKATSSISLEDAFNTVSGNDFKLDDIEIGDMVQAKIKEYNITKGKSYKVVKKVPSAYGPHEACITIVGDNGDTINKYVHKFVKPSTTSTVNSITSNDYDEVPISSIEDLKVGEKLIGTPYLSDLKNRKNIKPGVVVTYVGPWAGGETTHVNVELNGKVSNGFRKKYFNKLVPKKQAKYDFNVGDKLKCVNAPTNHVKLKVGEIYTVTSTADKNNNNIHDGDYICYVDNSVGSPVGEWYAHRFVKYDETTPNTPNTPETLSNGEDEDYSSWEKGDNVKCIDVTNMSTGWKLTLNKIYKIEDISKGGSYVSRIYTKDDNEKIRAFFPHRFVRVSKDQTPADSPPTNWVETLKKGDNIEPAKDQPELPSGSHSIPITAGMTIPEGSFVKCIDDSGWASGKITKGKLYKVPKNIIINNVRDGLWIVGDAGGGSIGPMAKRFELVVDSPQKPKRRRLPESVYHYFLGRVLPWKLIDKDSGNNNPGIIVAPSGVPTSEGVAKHLQALHDAGVTLWAYKDGKVLEDETKKLNALLDKIKYRSMQI